MIDRHPCGDVPFGTRSRARRIAGRLMAEGLPFATLQPRYCEGCAAWHVGVVRVCRRCGEAVVPRFEEGARRAHLVDPLTGERHGGRCQ